MAPQHVLKGEAMRFEGKLTQWNDDRGFGFITPVPAGQDVFVHISGFPRDGLRPQLSETLSFEITLNKDGKKQAVLVRRDRPASATSSAAPARARRDIGGAGSESTGLPTRIVVFVMACALLAAAYWHFDRRTQRAAAARAEAAFHQANVTVTENVVEACLGQQVRRLVHLSSPSIYFDGRDHVGITEEQVPKRFSDHYGATKYLAEQKVFGAAEFGLEVLALRPRFVTGAGDTSIFPRLINMQRKGRLSIIGNGLNKVDFTSVHNLNEALLSALFADDRALGQAYNISNGQPLPLWDVVNYVMRQMQLPQVTRYRSYGLAYSLAALNEAACMLWPGRPQPTLSRLGMQVMSRDFTLDISRARQYLDYQPKVSLWTALDEFCGWWKHLPPG